jgi:hypothetical protein
MGQEISKRLDATLNRTSFGTGTSVLRPNSGPDPHFFFTGDAEPGHRAGLLREHLPGESEAIIREADDICRHKFSLLGYGELDYGPHIDWHLDIVHDKRAPLKPWFKIDFLDFQKTGDHKVIWELNRHQHLITLAKARLLTGNGIYTRELVLQWQSWQADNSYPLGINWASTLEVAFRSLSWLWARNLLIGCQDLGADFHTELLLALQLHGHYIERYLSTYFSPNTHLIGEAVALFFIGTLCPEISAAERWRTKGWGILLNESEKQVRPDGVYFEQSLYYHVYALDFFLHARHLAHKNGFEIPAQFDLNLKKMLDVLSELSHGGSAEGFGDDDGGRVFNPRRNRIEHLTDPLPLGSIIYGDSYPQATLTEESIWIFGDKAIQVLKNACPPLSASSKVLLFGGIYLIRDDRPCVQQLMVDVGPQGIGRSGHGHADALSVRLSLDGHRILIDPGTFCYTSDIDQRNHFRGTRGHNTLTVDGLNQAIPAGPFAWNSIPNVKPESWLNGQTFDLLSGSQDGYRRLPNPVLHRRTIFHVKSGLWFVRDQAEGTGSHLLEIFWHFASGLELSEEHGVVFAKFPNRIEGAASIPLAILPDQTSRWQTEITEGLTSPAYGAKETASVVRFSTQASLPADCSVLLLPMTRVSDVGSFASIGDSQNLEVRGYRYQTSRATEFLFLSQVNRCWECGPWSSDAALLYCKLEGRRLAHAIMVSGSFAEWRGNRFVSLSSPRASFEWVDRFQQDRGCDPGGPNSGINVASDFEFVDSLT